MPAATYLAIIGEHEALQWVLGQSRMAFPAARAQAAGMLRPGDDLFLYTTRGCYHNPTRDRGRVIGEATIVSTPTEPAQPLVVAGRAFAVDCPIKITCLAPRGHGVVLADLVPRLAVFPAKAAWSAWMRRALLRLPDSDAHVVRRELRKVVASDTAAISTYR